MPYRGGWDPWPPCAPYIESVENQESSLTMVKLDTPIGADNVPRRTTERTNHEQ